MEKLNMQTTNIVDENIKRIGELFPNCLTERLNDEGKPEVAIDFDQLRQELSKDIVEGAEERYQFTWPDKRNAIRLANAPTTDTLRPCRKESVDFDNTQNLYIEGDNLQVLKLLRENYLGKVKMIYIDPPYNTGNDFVYNDNFDQDKQEYVHNSGQYDEEGNQLVTNTENNGRFHTDWLNMIYPRLKVAKDLLSDDGVMFISIDDNEVENLKKVCDEIFGERNFTGQWNWFKSATPPNLSKKIKKNIEYVLCYQKGGNKSTFSGVKKTSSSDDPITKPQNSLKELRFQPGWIHAKFPDGIVNAGIYGTTKFPNELLNDLVIENGVNKNEVTFRNKFIWVQETLKAQIKNGTRINLSKALVISYKKADYSAEVPPNLIDDTVGVDTTEKAGDDLDKLFDDNTIFDYPKPVSLVKYLTNFDTPKDDSIILDFFSGSATTAHAVMQLNAEDGGNRKFIMVQLPEATDEKSEAYKAGYKNICEIGKERIRRAGKKILEEQKTKQPDLFNKMGG
jgi:adenine-specific DNA-methyltransferase